MLENQLHESMIFAIKLLKSFQIILIQISVNNIFERQGCSQFVNLHNFLSQIKIGVLHQIHQLIYFLVDVVFKAIHTSNCDSRGLNSVVGVMSLNCLQSLHFFRSEVVYFHLLICHLWEYVLEFIKVSVSVIFNFAQVIGSLYVILHLFTLYVTLLDKITRILKNIQNTLSLLFYPFYLFLLLYLKLLVIHVCNALFTHPYEFIKFQSFVLGEIEPIIYIYFEIFIKLQINLSRKFSHFGLKKTDYFISSSLNNLYKLVLTYIHMF